MESMYTFPTAAEPTQATNTYVTHPFFNYIPGGSHTIPIDMTTNHGNSDMTTIPNDLDITTIPGDMTTLLRKLHVLRIIYNLI